MDAASQPTGSGKPELDMAFARTNAYRYKRYESR